ncbi:GLC7-interacting protein 2 [Sarracenia purpurea var. burkii]
MAFTIQSLLLVLSSLFFFFLFSLSYSYGQTSFRPDALVLPVTKDPTTLQYVTKISQRTPLVPVNLVVDLGSRFLWVDCENNYVSSTYRPVRCGSANCFLAGADGCGDCSAPPRPGCNNKTCGVSLENTVTRTSTGGELAEDVVSVQSTDGSNPGAAATVSNFLFSCAPTFLLNGLASGVAGMAGLGRDWISLTSQFASAFSFRRQFAICLSSSTSSNFSGVLFFGDGPYIFLPNINASQSLAYTPLFVNPITTASSSTNGDPSAEYFIGVTSINIGDKPVAVNASLLSINREGNGGTKISTVNPYTVMETSIYEAIVEAFSGQAAAINITRIAPVAPFSACFDSKNVFSTWVGPLVSYISLIL